MRSSQTPPNLTNFNVNCEKMFLWNTRFPRFIDRRVVLNIRIPSGGSWAGVGWDPEHFGLIPQTFWGGKADAEGRDPPTSNPKPWPPHPPKSCNKSKLSQNKQKSRNAIENSYLLFSKSPLAIFKTYCYFQTKHLLLCREVAIFKKPRLHFVFFFRGRS